MIYASIYENPIEEIVILADNEKLIKTVFKSKSNNLDIYTKKDNHIILRTKKWLDNYFCKNKNKIELPKLAIEGSCFQKTVLGCISLVKYGKTQTYGELAQIVANQLGRTTMSLRAIGQAASNNPYLIIIPCHRIIGKNNLGGYCCGEEIKRKLLEHESGFIDF